jgi:ferredoxin
MLADEEGFLYPAVDSDLCNDCGLCETICPILQKPEPSITANPLVFACWNRDDEVRLKSASGGVFSALAEQVLDDGGVVFGVAFDENMKVQHIAVECKEELGRLRSSKYVQSDIGHTYIEVKKLLKQNRTVLFSGTPCQVAALHAFLGKDNEKLLTCDIICKGVPSPGLFARYVEQLEKTFGAKLVNFNFRHKLRGWELASRMAYFADGRQYVLKNINDSFMYGFMNCFSLRRSCYWCPYTNTDRKGDITLGDFWGIGELVPFLHNTHKGISLILMNSQKGRRWLEANSNRICCEERSLEEAMYKQSMLNQPALEPTNRAQFFADYQRLGFEELASKHLIDHGFKGIVKRLVPRRVVYMLSKTRRRITGR